MTLDYAGAGDGQCLAIKADGERCTNGVYGSSHCCGTHKNVDDVTLAPEEDDHEYYYCDECGWQPAEWEQGGGNPPICADCGIEFGGPLQKWGRDNKRPVADGGTVEDGTESIWANWSATCPWRNIVSCDWHTTGSIREVSVRAAVHAYLGHGPIAWIRSVWTATEQNGGDDGE